MRKLICLPIILPFLDQFRFCQTDNKYYHTNLFSNVSTIFMDFKKKNQSLNTWVNQIKVLSRICAIICIPRSKTLFQIKSGIGQKALHLIDEHNILIGN